MMLAAEPAMPPEGPATLADVLDRILQRGVALAGNLTIGVAGVDLLWLDLRLLLAAIDTAWPEGVPYSRAAPAADPSVLPSAPAPGNDAFASKRLPVAPARAAVQGNIAPPAGDFRFRGNDAATSSGAVAAADGLARLVLTLVQLLHDVLERLAVHRMTAGRLTPAEIESVGAALLAQASEIARLRRLFDFSEDDLALRLGPADRAI